MNGPTKPVVTGLAPKKRWVIIFVIGISLLLCCSIPTALKTIISEASLLPSLQTEKEFIELLAALEQRWNNDESLPNTSIGFDYINVADFSEYEIPGYWLVIDMQYTVECHSTPSDPCNELADEIARIVFDNYKKVNELSGIKVEIGDQPFYLYIDPVDIQFQKILTIEKWREELSLVN